MSKGRPPRRPPCQTCGKPVVCYKSPYYFCGCGRFVQQADGALKPVAIREGKPCPTCGKNRLWKGGHIDYYRCRFCGASFNLVGGELVPTRKRQGRARPQKQEVLTAEEFEALNGWEPVEVEA